MIEQDEVAGPLHGGAVILAALRHAGELEDHHEGPLLAVAPDQIGRRLAAQRAVRDAGQEERADIGDLHLAREGTLVGAHLLEGDAPVHQGLAPAGISDVRVEAFSREQCLHQR